MQYKGSKSNQIILIPDGKVCSFHRIEINYWYYGGYIRTRLKNTIVGVGALGSVPFAMKKYWAGQWVLVQICDSL